MTLHLGKMPIKVHGILPALWLFSLLSGYAGKLFPSIAALFLHEFGHLLAAKWRKIHINYVEITPYGGLISVSELSALSPLSSFLLAFAGPLFSLLGCFLAVRLGQQGVISFYFAQNFARSNLLLLLINLLPALPMDGGRMLRAILCSWIPFQTATRWLVRIGIFIGWLLCMLSLLYAVQGTLLFSPALAGLYFFFTASLEHKQETSYFATSLISRRQQIQNLDCLEIIDLAAGEKMPLHRLLSRMHRGKIYRVHVLSDDGMVEEGIISEEELWNGLMSDNGHTLMDIIKTRQP